VSETHPEKRLIGYARVSTYGQTLDSQLEQPRAAGCTTRNIYREKVTGARRELLRMLDRLRPGDVVAVTRIDRLARSTFDLFGIVKRIVDAKAQFRSLAETWADHRHSHRHSRRKPPDAALRLRRSMNSRAADRSRRAATGRGLACLATFSTSRAR
jgi:Resolvase, N terminal domain